MGVQTEVENQVHLAYVVARLKRGMGWAVNEEVITLRPSRYIFVGVS